MDKRGQIAIFIILGLVLVAGVLFYFLIANNKTEITQNQRNDLTDPVYNYVDECLKSAAFDSVETFGLQQGYFEFPANSLDTDFSKIAYYYLNGQTIIPDNNFFEQEFGKIADAKISEECGDFSLFEDDGYSINANIERITSETKISEDKISLRTRYPISVRFDDSAAEISDFSYEIPVRIGHVLDVSRRLVEKVKEKPGETDLTFLLNQDVDVSIDDYDECNKIYILIDKNSTINSEPYAFLFAVKIDEQYCLGGQNATE